MISVRIAANTVRTPNLNAMMLMMIATKVIQNILSPFRVWLECGQKNTPRVTMAKEVEVLL